MCICIHTYINTHLGRVVSEKKMYIYIYLFCKYPYTFYGNICLVMEFRPSFSIKLAIYYTYVIHAMYYTLHL